MTPELFLGIVLVMFAVFGVPKDTNKNDQVVTIEAVKGNIEVENQSGDKIDLEEGEEIIIDIE